MKKSKIFLSAFILTGCVFVVAAIYGCACPPYRKAMMNMPARCSSDGIGDTEEAVHAAVGRFNTESYDYVVDNPFLRAKDNPLSTFSVDVDTASYANVRRFLNMGQLPPPGAVRIEELVNYFTYDYPPPTDGQCFSVAAEIAACPWNASHRLLRLGLRGKEIAPKERPPTNLVFLLDVSGSMEDEMKLPLVIRSMQMLVRTLGGGIGLGSWSMPGPAGWCWTPPHATKRKRYWRPWKSYRRGDRPTAGRESSWPTGWPRTSLSKAGSIA